MRRKLMVALVVATLFAPMGALPAMAGSNYCSAGQTSWQKSNSAEATQRTHNYRPVGSYWRYKFFAGSGWKYNNTGWEDLSGHSYTADEPVTYYAAYCVTGPS